MAYYCHNKHASDLCFFLALTKNEPYCACVKYCLGAQSPHQTRADVPPLLGLSVVGMAWAYILPLASLIRITHIHIISALLQQSVFSIFWKFPNGVE